MKFYLKTTKSKGEASLYCEVRRKNPPVRFVICSKVKVNVEAWEKSQSSANAWDKYIKTFDGANVKDKLDKIEKVINNLFEDGFITTNEDKKIIDEAVNDIIYAEERKRREEELAKEKEILEKERNKEKAHLSTILGFYHHFMSGIRSGQILHNNGYRYKDSSIETWNSFEPHLKDYVTNALMTFEDITPQFRDGFASHLADKGYMQNTVNKHVSAFQKLCRLSAQYGYNNNAITLQGWQAHEAQKDERKNAIYLNNEELDALFKMELNEKEGIVRDAFLVGCFTTQRYSDFSRISSEMVTRREDGSLFLVLSQNKTKKDVFIPVFDDRLKMILRKHNYNIPNVSDHQINKSIKDILFKLSFDVESLNEEYKTKASTRDYDLVKSYNTLLDQERKGIIDTAGKKYLRKLKKRAERNDIPSITKDGFIIKKKWQLVSTHTARRSGITNLVKTGKLTNRQIMTISGHATEKIFEHYIKMTGYETAQGIMDIMKEAKKTE